MPEEYTKITAEHYAAFRPPLHAPILAKCLKKGTRFQAGLDVGCGTGRSTVALAEYCTTVVGIDPSSAMLKRAIQNSKIKYLNGFLEESDIGSDSFDIITFAGALFYSRSQQLYNRVIQVGKPGSVMIIYDFEVAMKVIFERFDIPEIIGSEASYDHEINFSGLEDNRVKLKNVVKDQVNLEVSPSDLAHLVLSEKSAYKSLEARYGADAVFRKLRSRLLQETQGHNFNITVKIFYSVYQNIK